MISIYRTNETSGMMEKVNAIEPGTWIELTAPTQEELLSVREILELEPGFLSAALDEEETSRVEHEDGQTLIIVDSPMLDEKAQEDKRVIYSTIPLGIIVTEANIITVTLTENPIIEALKTSRLNTAFRTRFVFTLLLRIAGRYNGYLRQIDRSINDIERRLYKQQRNKELMQLLDMEKSLVYFSTSLKANEITIDKLTRGRVVKLYEEDQDLLEDVLIEIRQAIEMANIYSSILSSTMEAFSSVIDNNLNVNMKRLAGLTILIEMPNIIYGFYGMNIGNLPMPTLWFTLALSGGLTLITALILLKFKLL